MALAPRPGEHVLDLCAAPGTPPLLTDRVCCVSRLRCAWLPVAGFFCMRSARPESSHRPAEAFACPLHPNLDRRVCGFELAGAKLCMMSDMLAGSGSVTGVDIARPRLATCRTLLTKYHVPNCRLFLCDGRTFAAPPPSQLPQRTHATAGCEEAYGGGASGDAEPTSSCASLSPSSCFPHADVDAAVTGTNKTETETKDRDQIQRVETTGGCTRASGEPSQQATTLCGRGRASKRRRRRSAPSEAELTDTQPFFASTPASHTDGAGEAGSGDAAGLYDCVMVDAECTHDGSVKHITKYDQWGWNTFERRFLDPQRISTITELQVSERFREESQLGF
jgi:hypothetical protein